MILIDAVYEVLADSHLEFTKPAIVVLSLIHDTCFHLCGSDESAVKLPVYGHILEKMVHLCYEQQWYARHGGCSALLFIISAYPYSLIVDNAAHITSAITEVFFGLSDEVSFGTIEMARKAMRLLLKRCFPLATALPTKHLPEEYEEKQGQAAIAIVARLLDHIADPSTFVREQVMEIFSEMAEATGKSITDLLLLQKDKVKTFLDRGVSLFMSYACAAQIAFLEAYSFLQSDLNPVIPFDMKSHVHLHFLKNVVLVCEADEEKMERLPNYTAIAPSLEHPYPYPHDRLLPVKMAALKAAVGGYVAICVAKRKVEVPKYGTLQQYLDAVAKQFHPKPRTVSRSSSSSGSTDSSNSSSCTSSSSNSDVEMEKDDEEEEEAEERNVTQEDLIKGLSSFVLVEGMPYSTKHEYMQVDRKLELHMQLLQVVLKIVVHGHPRLQKAAFEAAEGALKLCVEGLGLVTREISLLTRNFEKTPNLDCIRMKQMLYLQKLTNGTGTEKFYDICFKELVKFKERKTGTKLKMEFVGCTHLLEMLVNTSTQDPSRWIGQFVPLVAKSDSDLALPGIEWKPLLRNYLNKHARQAVSYIVNEVNLLNEPTWRLYVEFIKEKDSLPIRKVFVENEDFFEHLLKEEVLFSSKWVTRTSHYMQIKYDLAVFSLLWVVVKHHPEWWTTCEKLKKIVHETWNNPSFVHRYAMRHEPREEQDRDKPIIDYVDETKYRLPKIVASITATTLTTTISSLT
ncbi:hypothetical protein L596_002674 [Steinernema carpocapsae]|uniref:Uncharacterized protein n=1 Tax=Steinernema carpocapsae TaxID=34508 RepID=A0A4U8UQA0_STECR|nr:hypothetical protein L596_002674 [Steinernema carpocapsae]